MASRNEKYPISLVLKAVDQATAPLRAFTARLNAMTAPVRLLSKSFADFGRATGIARLSEAFGGVRQSVGAVGRETMVLAGRLVGMTAAAGFAVATFGAKAIQAGDDLGKMAARLGLTVDEFAQLRFAAEQGDVSAESFSASMDVLNRSMGQLKSGTGPLRTFLAKVSPGMLAQMKAAKGNAEALDLLAGAFEAVEDPQRRAALTQAAFGRGGREMVGFFSLGTKRISEYRERFMELSGSQKAFAGSADEVDRAVRETRYALTGMGNSILTAFAPAFLELTRAVTGFIVANRGSLAKWARETAAAFGAWIRGGGLKGLMEGLKAFGDRALVVIEKLGGWKAVLVGIAAVMAGPLIGAIGGLVTSVVALAGAIGATPVGWIIAGLAAIAGLGVAIGANFENLKNLLGPVFEPMIPQLRELGAKLKELWTIVGPVLLPVLKVLGYVLGVVLYGALNAIVYIMRACLWLWDKLIGKFIDGAEEIRRTYEGLKILFTAGPAAWWTHERARLPSPDVSSRPTLNAPAPAMYQSTEAHVTVEFSNLPRGARVEADPRSTTSIDLGMGYSMATP